MKKIYKKKIIKKYIKKGFIGRFKNVLILYLHFANHAFTILLD